MSDSNIVFHDAVQLIYVDARRQVAMALKAEDAAQPYRLLTFALETAYPEILAEAEGTTAEQLETTYPCHPAFAPTSS